jgi:hypothetical protein
MHSLDSSLNFSYQRALQADLALMNFGIKQKVLLKRLLINLVILGLLIMVMVLSMAPKSMSKSLMLSNVAISVVLSNAISNCQFVSICSIKLKVPLKNKH